MQALAALLPEWPLWTKLLLLALPILPNLWCIWHSFNHEFPNPPEKFIWLGAGVFLPVLGGLLYLFWGRTRIIKK